MVMLMFVTVMAMMMLLVLMVHIQSIYIRIIHRIHLIFIDLGHSCSATFRADFFFLVPFLFPLFLLPFPFPLIV